MSAPTERRAWPPLGFDLSRAFHSSLPVDRDRAGLALVERALGAGVEWVDCGTGARVPDLERRCAAALLRSPKGASASVSTTLSGDLRTDGARAGEGRPDPGRPQPLFEGHPDAWTKALEEAVDRSAHRLGRSRLSIAWIEGADLVGLRDPTVRRALEEMRDEGGPLDAWGVRFSHLPAGRETRDRSLAARAPFLAIPLHLLNAADALELAHEAAAAGTGVIATDPFAEGLLDGSWFSPTSEVAARGPSGPPAWSLLRDRFEPVRRLGYLTADRRRTLPQAALRFLWGCPEVTGVLVAPRDPRELDAALGAASAPPLTEEERRRVLAGPTAPLGR